MNSAKVTTLIQLSGGIDSVYVLWDWLKNNPEDICIVHHINLINHESRVAHEKQAVTNVMKWLSDNGLKNYIYLENTFDYGTLGYIIKDVEICGFHAGIILRNEKWVSLKNILIPVYKNDTKRERLRRLLIKEVSYGKGVSITYPLSNITKKQVIELMPKELFDMCWYCRKPINNQKCGKCHTCNEVERAMQKNN